MSMIALDRWLRRRGQGHVVQFAGAVQVRDMELNHFGETSMRHNNENEQPAKARGACNQPDNAVRSAYPETWAALAAK